MDPKLQFLEERERFLPVRKAALRERMLADPRLSPLERVQISKLFELIEARFHFDFRSQFERLKTLYDPFDPDEDVLPSHTMPIDPEAQRQELSSAFTQLLLEANYTEMPWERIIACAEHQSQVGVTVKANLSDYAQLQVFYRGIRHEQRSVRLWLMPWKKRRETAHVFARVALLVRLANSPKGHVFLKLFKNVVAEDLEMLLPYVRIQMRLLDHLKIGSSVAGGIATAVVKIFTAAILSSWALVLILLGFLWSAVRSFHSFMSSKTKYMQALSSNLYFQNLANNIGAVTQLIDCAEAEECKELLLAYYILYLERNRDFTQEALDRRVEQWLQTEFGLDIDFEVSDAVRKLAEKQLLVRRPLPGDSTAAGPCALKVFDLPSALRRIDAAIDEYYTYNGDRLPEDDRVADQNGPPYPPPAENLTRSAQSAP